jgi:tetratricopeptide (TPR) repeat protein
MKRALWIALTVAVLASAGIGLLAVSRTEEWTTSSPAALLEFVAGRKSRLKIYYAEAAAHFEQALKLDPDFAAAKVFLIRSPSVASERKKQLIEELRQDDLSRLTPREQYLVKRAVFKDDGDERLRLIDEYLAEYPKDVYALNDKASLAMIQNRFEESERLYREIIEIDPNWVWGYNHLGYLTMGQGRFTEAEEHFIFYRFIAADQANPHDSLGELYFTLGRYEEAIACYEKALTYKPDFPSPYEQMFSIYLLQDDPEAARGILERAEAIETIDQRLVCELRCALEFERLARAQDWHQILDGDGSSTTTSNCFESRPPRSYRAYLSHLAACKLGRFDEARSYLDQVRKLAGSSSDGSIDSTNLRALLHHYEAIQAAFRGDLDTARSKLLEADQILPYYGVSLALFKLSNRLLLAEVLNAQGQKAEARHWLDQVREVNPQMARRFEEHGMSLLDLDG